MNARELIQSLKSQLDQRSNIDESEITVDIIGNSQEAKANVYMPVEGKTKIIEITAKTIWANE